MSTEEEDIDLINKLTGKLKEEYGTDDDYKPSVIKKNITRLLLLPIILSLKNVIYSKIDRVNINSEEGRAQANEVIRDFLKNPILPIEKQNVQLVISDTLPVTQIDVTEIPVNLDATDIYLLLKERMDQLQTDKYEICGIKKTGPEWQEFIKNNREKLKTQTEGTSFASIYFAFEMVILTILYLYSGAKNTYIDITEFITQYNTGTISPETTLKISSYYPWISFLSPYLFSISTAILVSPNLQSIITFPIRTTYNTFEALVTILETITNNLNPGGFMMVEQDDSSPSSKRPCLLSRKSSFNSNTNSQPESEPEKLLVSQNSIVSVMTENSENKDVGGLAGIKAIVEYIAGLFCKDDATDMSATTFSQISESNSIILLNDIPETSTSFIDWISSFFKTEIETDPNRKKGGGRRKSRKGRKSGNKRKGKSARKSKKRKSHRRKR